ncbi:MAG: Nitrogen regulation protein NR(I) [Verrucomicrobia subdivision 3 bacterium]|nr:Nitrogen regulation protein NR(I) [Limisphaerales bacterium]MCS1417528.1 Nitrogen regulation protein NR(I) [Limisphaerales bacterium]
MCQEWPAAESLPAESWFCSNKMEKILLIDDEADVLYAFRRIFDSPETQIITASSGEEGIELYPQVQPDLVIMDVRMGGMNGLQTLEKLRAVDVQTPVIMMTAYGTTKTAIESMKLGAYDYLLKPFDVPKLQQLVYATLKASRDMRQSISLEHLEDPGDDEIGIVGRSEAMQKVLKLVGQLAASQATALITGESGTGKEIVARAIYQNSLRASKPYLAINCAAIPENLLESELFGHEKGAFTGATALRIGKFEQCNQGTIFLDEIGDMALHTQTRILRVLQSGTFERVGSNKPVEVDVRIIAATNKNLEEAVAEKQFREDLFYRLNVVRIHLPPLREHRDDIRLLVSYFLKKFSTLHGGPGKSISGDALAALENYDWPGNVRELENIVQRSLVVTKGEAILLGNLPPEVLGKRYEAASTTGSDAALSKGADHDASTNAGAATDISKLAGALFRWAQESPDLKILPAVERELVCRALQETHGNQLKAAALLGITRATLRKRIEKFGIQQTLDIN